MNNIEWLNGNTTRAYPFMDDVSRIATNGAALPNSVLADMSVILPNLGNRLPYIQTINVSADSVSGLIYVGAAEVATFSGSITGPYSRLTVVGTGEFTSARGVLVTGDPNVFLKEFVGSLVFDEENALLAPRGSYTVPSGLVDGVSAVSGGVTLGTITSGVVNLLAGNGVRLTVVPPSTVTDTDPITGEEVSRTVVPSGIRIDVVGGDYDEECDCGDGTRLPEPIRTINGVGGDAVGNINLVSKTDCVNINNSTAQIHIEDTCSNPCCGCAELEFVNNQLATYRATIESLEAQVAELTTAQTDFSNNVLASL